MGEQHLPLRLLFHRLSGGAQLSQDEMDALRAIVGPAKRFNRGEVLVEQGEKSPRIWLTGSGWAFRQKMLDDGRRQILAIVLPGELSEKGPIMPFGSPDSVVAATDMEAHPITRQALQKAAEAHPRLLQALFYEELTRHAITREWVLLLGQRKAEERLAYVLFETYVRLKAMGMITGDRFDFPITQLDLADIVGMSTVHLNRTLQELRRRALVIWSAGVVELPDPAALARLARFDKGFQRVALDFAERAATPRADRRGGNGMDMEAR